MAVVCVLLRRSPTFLLFFGWPQGGTWSNTIAWIESLALAGFATWYLRDRVGRGLVGWFHQHHGPIAQDQLNEHHQRLAEKVDYNHLKLERDLAEIKSYLRSLHRRLDGS